MQNLGTIFETIDSLRRKLFSYALVQAASWILAIVLVIFISLGLLDMQFRFSGKWYPLTAFSVTALLLIISFGRLLLPILLWRPSVVDVARQLEPAAGAKNNELSSAARFVTDRNDIKHQGSGLYNETISKADRYLQNIELSKLLQIDRIVFSIAIFAITLSVLLALLILRPEETRLAGLRIVAPWENRPWPTRFDFEFDDPPESVFSGGSIELIVKEIHGKGPDEVYLKIDYHGNQRDQVIRAEPVPNRAGKFSAKLTNIQESFSCWAYGGDGKSDKLNIEVIPKINIKDVSVTVVPPGYTEAKPEVSRGIIRGVAGSTIHLTAALDQPVKSAVLKFESIQESKSIELAIENGGKLLRFDGKENPWVMQYSGQFRLELVDQGNRPFKPDGAWEIVCMKDAPPVVNVELQTGFEKVSTFASFGCLMNATDDIGIANWSITLTPQNGGHGETLVIDQGQYQSFFSTSPPKQVAKHFTIDVSKLPQNQSSQWKAVVVAVDMKGQVTESSSSPFEIVGRKTLVEFWNGQLKVILDQSRESLDVLQSAKNRLQLFESTLDSSGEQANTSRHLLALSQDNIKRFLSIVKNQETGPIARIDVFLDRFRANRITQPVYDQNLRRLQRELRNALIRHDQRDTSLLSDAKSLVKSKPQRTKSHIKSVSLSLQRSIDNIRAELAFFEQWYQNQTIRAEIAQISKDQSVLLNKTRTIEFSVIGKRFDELPIELQKKIAEIAAAQSRIHQEFLNFQSRINQRVVNSENAEQAGKLLNDLLEKRIAELMQRSAQEIGQNKVGNGIDSQANIVKLLSNVMADLDEYAGAVADQNSIDQSSGELVSRLREIYEKQEKINENVDARLKENNSFQGYRDIAEDQTQLRQQLIELGPLVELQAQKTALKWVRDQMQSIINDLYQNKVEGRFRQKREIVLSLLKDVIAAFEVLPNERLSSTNPDAQDSDNRSAQDNRNPNIDASELFLVLEIQSSLNKQCDLLFAQKANAEISKIEFEEQIKVLSNQQKDIRGLVESIVEKAKGNSNAPNSRGNKIPDLPDF